MDEREKPWQDLNPRPSDERVDALLSVNVQQMYNNSLTT